VRVSGEKPGTHIDRDGRFVAYGITMLKNAPNREAAEAFLAYLLDPEGGQKILRQYGQPPFEPPFVPTLEMYQKLPDILQAFSSPPGCPGSVILGATQRNLTNSVNI
jgi:molybdate/tungstate transport system substrate-binding protein